MQPLSLLAVASSRENLYHVLMTKTSETRSNSFSDTLSETFSRRAADAKDILGRTASLVDTEWQRLLESVDGAERVPSQVKQAVGRLDGVVDSVKREASTVAENGRRVVEQIGDTLPTPWRTDTEDADTDTVIDSEIESAVDDKPEARPDTDE